MNDNNRSLSTWFILALSLFGFSSMLGPALQRNQPSSSVPASSQSKNAESDSGSGNNNSSKRPSDIETLNRLDEVIGEHLGQPQPFSSRLLNDPYDALSRCRVQWFPCLTGPVPFGYPDIDSLVVLIPDPTDTASGYQFNDVLESVQQALSTDGYVLDRYRLPWKAKSNVPLKGFDDPRQVPGVVLLRKAEEAHPTLLMLYLVGETPTGGIHKEALRLALTHRERLLESVYMFTSATEIRIVGPCFTGSADSLALALGHWNAGRSPNRISVIAPATGVDPRKFEESVKQLQLAPLSKAADVKFRSSNVSLESARNELLAFVSHLHSKSIGDRPRIAWLRESGTGYGQKNRPREKDKQSEKVESDKYEIVDFSFPVHISQLRDEFDQQQRQANDSATPVARSSRKLNLRVPFDNEVQTAIDVVPTLVPKMGAATTEYALAQICEALRREQFPYVGIQATDIRDRIFLASIVRQYSPDTQLLIINSDLLLSHPDYQSVLRGALVASGYPLFPENQLWTAPFRESKEQLVFANNSIQAYYNAVLLIRHPESWTSSVCSECRDTPLPLVEYGKPFDIDRNVPRHPPTASAYQSC